MHVKKSLKQYKAGVILIDDQNRVLLVQNYDGKWTFPKGGIECGESTEAAAVRELFEETGIRLTKAQMKIFYKTYKQTYFIYRACDITYDEELISDKREITGIGWFCMEHFQDFNTARPTSRIMEMIKEDMVQVGAL